MQLGSRLDQSRLGGSRLGGSRLGNSRFSTLRNSTAAFTPAPLFASGEEGVWLDPSDTSTLFQDTAGTTPVTAPGQTVALALDKSQGLTLGPELVTNGTFDTDSDWTKGAGWTIGGGVASYDGTNAPNAISQGTTVPVPGTSYQVAITVSMTQGALIVRPNVGAVAGQYQITASGTYNLVLVGGNGSFGCIAGNFGGRFIGTIDNISIRELPGNHATQATAAARPTYGIVPKTGRRNKLTYTEQFYNADWPTKTNVTASANQTTAPDGTNTADLIVDNATNAQHRIFRGVTSIGAQTTISLFAKASSADRFQLVTSNGTSTLYATFNLSSGSVSFTSPGATADIVTLGDGWFRCSLTQNDSAGLLQFQVGLTNGLDSGTALPSYIGSGTGIYIWGAQLEEGSTATDYQKVVSQYEVTEAGVPSLGYLSFDGVDDFMVTPTITPGTDKVQVFAGVTPLGMGGSRGAITNLNVGNFNSFGLNAPSSFISTIQFVGFGDNPGGHFNLDEGSISNGTTMVLTGVSEMSSGLTLLRRNGAQVDSGGTAGAGNFAAAVLSVGAWRTSSSPFNGQLYSLIARFGPNLDTSAIENTESYVAGKTGVTL